MIKHEKMHPAWEVVQEKLLKLSEDLEYDKDDVGENFIVIPAMPDNERFHKLLGASDFCLLLRGRYQIPTRNHITRTAVFGRFDEHITPERVKEYLDPFGTIVYPAREEKDLMV